GAPPGVPRRALGALVSGERCGVDGVAGGGGGGSGGAAVAGGGRLGLRGAGARRIPLGKRGLPPGRRKQLVLSAVPRGEQGPAEYGTATEGARPDLGGQRGHTADPFGHAGGEFVAACLADLVAEDEAAGVEDRHHGGDTDG